MLTNSLSFGQMGSNQQNIAYFLFSLLVQIFSSRYKFKFKILACYYFTKLNSKKMSQITLAHCSSQQSIEQSKQDSYSIKPQKSKLIRKKTKKNAQSSKCCDSEETNPSSPLSEIQQIQIFSPTRALKSVFLMVRDIIKKARFGIDSYLASLKILQKMSFEGNQTLHRLVAASIVSIVGKVHQCRNLSYNDLINWGERCFTKSDLIKSEAEILKGIGFQVPLVNHFRSEFALVLEVKDMEKFFS